MKIRYCKIYYLHTNKVVTGIYLRGSGAQTGA